MTVPNRDPIDTKKSEQNIYNNTYDEDFDVIAVEMLGYDSVNQVLVRIKVNADGTLPVTF